jgi:hypothetical protein
LDHEKLQQVMYLTDTLKIFKRLLTLKF